MPIAVLELNDTGVRVTGDSRVFCESPAYVLVDGKHILSGVDARSSARLTPRKINTRFWNQLNLEPLNLHTSRVKHNADLAWFHMTEIRKQIPAEFDEFVFAVPGTFSKDQLGLLLGIAQECAIPVSGLVDSALVAVASQQVDLQSVNHVMHLDIQMHRITLTRIDVLNGYERVDVEVLAKSGLVTLQEVWAEAVGDLFVRHTRFDPMHRAQTEQALYNVMPDWLSRLQTDSVIDIQMTTGRREYSVVLSRELMVNAVAELYQRIIDQLEKLLSPGLSVQIILSHRLVPLPGFVDSIKSRLPDCNLRVLEQDSVTRGVALYDSQILTSDDAVHFITQLKTNERAKYLDAELARSFYIVYEDKAYQLSDVPIQVICMSHQGTLSIKRNVASEINDYCLLRHMDNGVMLEIHGEEKVFVNQQRISRNTKIEAGASIHLGECSTSLRLVRLVE